MPIARRRSLVLALFVVTVLGGTLFACSGTRATLPLTQLDSASLTEGSLAHHAERAMDDIAWGPVPPGFPDGAKLAVVQGDPAVVGAVFTIRLRMPNGYVLPPHFHPEDEHVTVLAGQFEVGLGNVVDAERVVASLQRYGFITAPKMHTHWGIARGETVVQVHGIGPFATTFVDAQGQALDPELR